MIGFTVHRCGYPQARTDDNRIAWGVNLPLSEALGWVRPNVHPADTIEVMNVLTDAYRAKGPSLVTVRGRYVVEVVR